MYYVDCGVIENRYKIERFKLQLAAIIKRTKTLFLLLATLIYQLEYIERYVELNELKPDGPD